MMRRFSAIGFLLAIGACNAAPSRANEEAPAPSPMVTATADVEAPATPSASNAAQDTGEQSTEEINKNVVAALRTNLLAVKATFDGSPITDLLAKTACESTVVTSAGRTALPWGSMGNIAARIKGPQQTVQLPAEDLKSHVLSVPHNDDGDGIVGSIGLLVSNCESDPFFAR